jgi:hypothetical protein
VKNATSVPNAAVLSSEFEYYFGLCLLQLQIYYNIAHKNKQTVTRYSPMICLISKLITGHMLTEKPIIHHPVRTKQITGHVLTAEPIINRTVRTKPITGHVLTTKKNMSDMPRATQIMRHTLTKQSRVTWRQLNQSCITWWELNQSRVACWQLR